VDLGVGFVLELAAQEPAVRVRELDRLAEHAGTAQRRRREYDLRAEEPHHAAPLDAEVLSHHDDQRIALLRAHHREADAGVAARRLDHRLPGLERTAALCRFDHAEREPVLDRAHRIAGLELHVEVHAGRCELPDLHDRRPPHGLENVVVPGHRSLPGPTIARKKL
jgi:hypothetical protein